MSKTTNFIYRHVFAGADLGKAFYLFSSQKYSKAVVILEKCIARLPENEKPEISLSILGQCYLAMGQSEKALDPLSKAFERYQGQREICTDRNFVEQYHEMIKAYGRVLQLTGNSDQAEEVIKNLEWNGS